MDAPFPEGMLEEIERFLSDDNDPPGLDLYERVFQTNLMFPLQRQTELRWMIRQARKVAPKVVMDIGSDKGGGLYHWCKCLTTVEQVIACEVRGLPYARLFEKAFPKIKFYWLEDSSHHVPNAYAVAKWLGFHPCLDVLFIDGDKLAMERDFDCYRPLFSYNFRAFLHDVQDREPKTSYQALLDRGYDGEVYVNLDDTVVALGRQYKSIPPATPHEGWLRHWYGRSCGVGMLKYRPLEVKP